MASSLCISWSFGDSLVVANGIDSFVVVVVVVVVVVFRIAALLFSTLFRNIAWNKYIPPGVVHPIPRLFTSVVFVS